MNEPIQAIPEMQLFFEKLLGLKKYVKEKKENATEVREIYLLDDIYNRFDEIIKEQP